MQSNRPYSITTLSRSGLCVSAPSDAVEEHVLHLSINRQLAVRLICTPNMLYELVLGHLYSRGYIETLEDIRSLDVYGGFAAVELQNQSAPDVLLLLNSAGHTPRQGFPPEELPPHAWEPQWIFSLADYYARNIGSEEKKYHCCLLADKDTLLYSCHDLSRHNALNKIIGCTMRDGLPLAQAILFCNTRISSDLMRQAIQGGIPIVVSNVPPTQAAVTLAQEHGATLLTCSADRLDIYHDASRAFD